MADEFYPRLTDYGIQGNPYWYSNNPLYNAGYGLPNCTCYAWGRFWEEAGSQYRPSLSTSDAEYWWGYTSDGYARGSTPALGSVLCLADGPYSGAGHVAIVEVINSDGSIVVSESAWNAYYFQTETLYPPNYLPVAGYVFQGFIYNPHSGGQPIPPTPTGGKKIWYFKRMLWKNEKETWL